MEVIRATKLWQQAAAYYVRIGNSIEEFNIPANIEIDENDKPDTKYIVVFDDILPVGTCRLHLTDDETAKIERVMVLKAYQNKGIGRLAVTEAEIWLTELGVKKIIITSRQEAVGFYEKLGYTADYSRRIQGAVFSQIYTYKILK